MATMQDNITTIQTAVYGKDMRPAISEALTQSWNSVKVMMNAVDKLNTKVEALAGQSPDGGGDSQGGVTIVGTVTPPIVVVYGKQTTTVSVGSIT